MKKEDYVFLVLWLLLCIVAIIILIPSREQVIIEKILF
jgi:hypothetical protein